MTEPRASLASPFAASTFAALLVTLAAAAAPPAAASDFTFSMDGETAPVAKVSDRGLRARVATTVASGETSKQISGVGHELDVEVGLADLPAATVDWINESLARRYARRDGTWVETDAWGKARARSFFDAHIVELGFPALDASLEEQGDLVLKIAADEVADASLPRISTRQSAPAAKSHAVVNFRVEIGDLPCERVSKIDAFQIEQSVVTENGLEMPNLQIYLPAADADAWQAWFQSFVIDGKDADSDELDGQITLLGPDQEEVLGQVHLRQLGIAALSYDHEASSEAGFAVVKAELYVESLQIELAAR